MLFLRTFLNTLVSPVLFNAYIEKVPDLSEYDEDVIIPLIDITNLKTLGISMKVFDNSCIIIPN